MNKLKVVINKTELPIKEYHGQRVVTLKEIDAVHERPEGTARRNFNTNKEHLIEEVDFFQLDQPDEIRTLGIERPQGGTPQAVTLITESGYLMLVKSFTDDLAWTVQRQLVNTYFRATPAQKKDAALQTEEDAKALAADKRATAMLLNAKNRTANFLRSLYNQAGVKPEYQALALSDFYSVDGVNLPRIALQGTKVTYDKGTIAKMLGVYSKASHGKKPHAAAIGAIIGQLTISAEEQEAVPYSRNGHDGVDYQYTLSVADKVSEWLNEAGRPETLILPGKTFHLLYQPAERLTSCI